MFRSIIFRQEKEIEHTVALRSLIIGIDVEIEAILDLEVLSTLIRVCKTLAIKGSRWLRYFYSIVESLHFSHKFSREQIEIYRINGHYTIGHSSWFIAASYGGFIDYMITKIHTVNEEDKNNKKSCEFLKCTVGCMPKLSLYDKIVLLHPAVIKKEKLNGNNTVNKTFFSLLLEWDAYEYIVPWLLYTNCDVRLVSKLFINNDILRIKYRILLQEFFCFGSYWEDLYGRISRKRIDVKKGYNMNTNNEEALNAIKFILSDPDKNFQKFARIASIGISDVLLGNIVSEIRMLCPKKGSIGDKDFKILHYTITRGFSLFFDRGSVAHLTIFSAAAVAMRLIDNKEYWPIPTPIGMNVICIIMDSTLGTTVAGTFQTFGGISSYAKFIVLTYLFGIPPSMIIVTEHSLVPLGFNNDELFSSRSLMVSDIIFEIGGRGSSYYIALRTKCVELLCQIRHHYSIITSLLSPIMNNIDTSEILKRWEPISSKEHTAIKTFIKTFDESIKGSLGMWTLLGY